METLVETAVATSARDPLLLAGLAFFAAAAEALVVVGAVVPGTAILIAVAALAGAQASSSLALTLLAAACLGAIAGDGTGYWLGRRYGRDLFGFWPLSQFPDWLPRGERYFARHGGKSVFWGRFVPGVKTVVPVVAGISRMSPLNFLAANVASALIWSFVLVAGGLGLGRGLDRFGLADRRVVILLVALGVALALAFLLLRLVLMRGMPALAVVWRGAMQRLAARPGRSAGLAGRMIADETGVLLALVWAAAVAVAVAGFAALLGQVILDADFSRADAVLSNAVQALRFRNLDAAMVAVTMAGDGIVLAALALATLLWLLALRQWRAGAGAAIAFAATMLFVPLVKALLARERPVPLDADAVSFSFPSGHASHTMVVFGVVAILIAHHLGAVARLGLYFAAVAVAVAVALSRVYLGVHWPSDVGAGLLFGAAVVASLGFALRDRRLALRPAWMALMLAAVYGLAYGVNLDRGYGRWSAAYARPADTLAMTEALWRADGWNLLAPARVGLGEGWSLSFSAQLAGDPAAVARALALSGWSVQRAPPVQRLLSSLLPYGDLAAMPAQMLLHDGRPPVAVLVHAPVGGRRLVLRLWPSGAALIGDPAAPIALAGLSAEAFTPVALGFGDLDRVPATVTEVDDLRAALTDAPELAASVPPAASQRPAPPLLLRAMPR